MYAAFISVNNYKLEAKPQKQGAFFLSSPALLFSLISFRINIIDILAKAVDDGCVRFIAGLRRAK